MAIEVRPAAAEEMERFLRIRGYAFADHRNEFPGIAPELTLCGFVDGVLASTSAAWPFTLRWNGAPIRAAGVTMVATSPEYRRRGVLRRIMQHALPAYRQTGQAIAVLWASYAAIYQRFGFGPASHTVYYRFDPARAAWTDPAPAPGRIELLSVSEALDVIKPLYVEYAAPRTLALHRAGAMWHWILRVPDGQGVFVAVYRAADGSPRGYALYETHLPQSSPDATRSPDVVAPFQQLVVRDWVALDAEAYRGLWQFVCAHDLVQTVSMGPLPPDDPAPLRMAEPRQLFRRVNDGIWLRVVDAERALAERGYDRAGELTLEVRGDLLCDWNDGCYRIETGSGRETHVRRVTEMPELTLDPRSLASLLAGHASASELYAAGLLDAKDPRTLLRADALFATRHRPHCPDAF